MAMRVVMRRAAMSMSMSMGVALAASGCSSPGTLVQRHAPAEPVGVTHVSVPGVYGLFKAGADQPLLQYSLRVGDKLGFERSVTPARDDLQIQWLYGVAGAARGRLDDTLTYEWRRLPEDR